MYFLQLSQAPPELDMEIANCTEEPREPVRSPKTAWTPKREPASSGDRITRHAGATISFKMKEIHSEPLLLHNKLLNIEFLLIIKFAIL